MSEARALELRQPPVGLGAEFGCEGVRGRERPLECAGVRHKLGTNPSLLDALDPVCYGSEPERRAYFVSTSRSR